MDILKHKIIDILKHKVMDILKHKIMYLYIYETYTEKFTLKIRYL